MHAALWSVLRLTSQLLSGRAQGAQAPSAEAAAHARTLPAQYQLATHTGQPNPHIAMSGKLSDQGEPGRGEARDNTDPSGWS